MVSREAGTEVVRGMNEAQLVVLGLVVLALVVGVAALIRFFWVSRREQRRGDESLELERLAWLRAGERDDRAGVRGPAAMALRRPTVKWAFPMPAQETKKYVPPVNGTVRVHPGGIVRSRDPERWDLYVPPAAVDIPVIPSSPAVPDIAEYRGHGGGFGGSGASGSWASLVEVTSSAGHESGVHAVGAHDGGGDGGGGFDNSGGGGGSD